jgi:hypothetical protein
MIQLLPGIRIKVPNKHSTYGRGKVKTIQLISGKHSALRCYTATLGNPLSGKHNADNLMYIYSNFIYIIIYIKYNREI